MAIRAFIAVPIVASDRLADFIRSLSKLNRVRGPKGRRILRTVDKENLHLTMRFLGDIDPSQLPAIEYAIEQAVDGQTGFHCHAEGVGTFPHEGRPSVVWVGCQDGGVLASITEMLTESLAALEFARPTKPWHSHVTVARINVRPPDEFRQIVDTYRQADFGTTPVSHIHLMRSELSSGPPVYRTLSRVRLES